MHIDYLAIANLLPHRHPFLFVDRIEAFEPGRRIVATRAVAHDVPWLVRDAAGLASVPATLLLECVAQVGAVLVLATPAWHGRVPYVTGMDRVRLRRMLGAGEEASIEVSVQRMIGPAGRMAGVVRVGGKLIARGRMTFVLGPPTDAGNTAR